MAKRSKSFILIAALLFAFFVGLADAQRTAVIAPNGSELDKAVAGALAESVSSRMRLQDIDMSMAAYSAVKPADPFNMTADEARRVGLALGSDFFVLLNSGTRRRASIEGPEQFESYVAIYVVSSQTGLLGFWKMISASAASPDASRGRLQALIPDGSREIIESVRERRASTPLETANIAGLPDPASADAKGFRAPIPYRRIKPEYTRLAYLYDITATVEATVDLDENGVIRNIAITRWAGYGLDESVEKTITAMKWRPAERNGKFLPARFLVRYNFRKIEKDDSD